MSIITSAVGMGVKVLAIAETNISVDNMTRRLARIGVAVLRLGRVEKVDGDMVEHTLEGQLKTQAEQESRKVKFTDQRTGRSIPKKADLARVLKRADVVLTTCAGAGDPMLRFHLISKQFKFSSELLCSAGTAPFLSSLWTKQPRYGTWSMQQRR